MTFHQQAQLLPGFSANRTLGKLSPHYLRPKPFLSLQQKSRQISYKISPQQFQPKLFCSKYFGKKILYVMDSHDLHRAVHSCKLFQRVKFDKNVCSKEEFKATGDLMLIGKDLKIEMNQITKAVRGCKGKVSIVLNKNKYWYTKREMEQRRGQENPIVLNYSLWLRKWLRNCDVDLQSLSLIFHRVDQFPDFKDCLRNLKHFSLQFDKKFARKCGWRNYADPESPFEDLKDKNFISLLRIIRYAKQLQTLRLDLAPYSLTSTSLAYLLLTLNDYKIPDWYVRMSTVSEDFMKLVNGISIEEINEIPPRSRKSTSEVLEKVDFLAINVVNYLEGVWDDFAYDKYEDYGAFRKSVARLGELPEVTCKYKRILDVTLTDFSLETKSSFHRRDSSFEKWTVNLKAMLSCFPELQGLYLKVVENVVTFEENHEEEEIQQTSNKRIQKVKEDSEMIIENLEDVFEWTRNLKEVFITFLALSGTNKFDFESETQSFSKLMGVLKTQCPQLTSLNVFRGHPVFDWDGQLTICEKVPLIVPCEEIAGVSNLRELEITSDNNGLKSLGKALETLKNLEKLKMNIVNNDLDFTSYEFLDENPCETKFYEFDEREKVLSYLPGLKELELVINRSGHSVRWAEHFAKYIGSLKSLEILKVIDLNKDEIRLEVLMKIVDGLSRKRNLKRVEIDCVIVKDDSTLEFAAGLWDNGSKGDIEDLAIKNLQAKIVQVVDLNPKLEFVDIKDFKEMNIERIFSDMRTKIQ